MSSDQNKPAAIQGQRVGLRPVVQSDIAVLDSWTNDLAIQGDYNMFGLERENGSASGFQARGLLDDDQGTLMIVTLAGAIVGYLAQGLNPFDAAVAAAYVHGYAGELAENFVGSKASVLASDIVATLADSIGAIERVE